MQRHDSNHRSYAATQRGHDGNESLSRTPGTARATWLSALICLGASSHGCGIEPQIAWRITFACPAAAESVTAVRTRVLSGGCGGEPIYEANVGRDERGAAAPQDVGLLTTEIHGFEAVALDERGEVLAQACRELRARRAEVELVLGSTLCAGLHTGDAPTPDGVSCADGGWDGDGQRAPCAVDDPRGDCPQGEAPDAGLACACGAGSASPGGRCVRSDQCPGDPDKDEPGTCGCGVPDTDRDGDGTADCEDPCALDPAKTEPGSCGCGRPEGSCAPRYGLRRAYYRGAFNALPDFRVLNPENQEVVQSIDISDYAGAENFGVLFTGLLQIETAGEYEFELGSDDGSRLIIDGVVVVDNDGPHEFTTRAGRARLTEGRHTIRVEYFERTGKQGLQLRYRTGAAALAEIPATLLSHD